MTPHPFGPSHVPDLLLERYRLGEMPASETDDLRTRMESDSALRQRYLALEHSDAAIRTQYPSAWLAGRIRLRASAQRLVQPAAQRRFGWRTITTAAAAAVVVITIGSHLRAPGKPPSPVEIVDSTDAGVRIKGSRLMLFRRTADGSEVLADGSAARAGDVIRLGYRAAGQAYGVILSIDGRGIVTRHMPQHGDRAVALDGGSPALLGSAYELDDAPGWECFYFVSGKTEFDLAPVMDAAFAVAARTSSERPAPLVLPQSLEQSSLVLMKEARR